MYSILPFWLVLLTFFLFVLFAIFLIGIVCVLPFSDLIMLDVLSYCFDKFAPTVISVHTISLNELRNTLKRNLTWKSIAYSVLCRLSCLSLFFLLITLCMNISLLNPWVGFIFISSVVLILNSFGYALYLIFNRGFEPISLGDLLSKFIIKFVHFGSYVLLLYIFYEFTSLTPFAVFAYGVPSILGADFVMSSMNPMSIDSLLNPAEPNPASRPIGGNVGQPSNPTTSGSGGQPSNTTTSGSGGHPSENRASTSRSTVRVLPPSSYITRELPTIISSDTEAGAVIANNTANRLRTLTDNVVASRDIGDRRTIKIKDVRPWLTDEEKANTQSYCRFIGYSKPKDLILHSYTDPKKNIHIEGIREFRGE